MTSGFDVLREGTFGDRYDESSHVGSTVDDEKCAAVEKQEGIKFQVVPQSHDQQIVEGN